MKLLAANLDRLSSAFAIIGVITPVIAWSYEFASAPPRTGYSVAFSGIWLVAAASLHLLARRVLRRLQE
ncbi:MAG TPA: hypothetical protein VF641_06015 [Methylobacterium sp.]|jgi:hypothetical protein